MCVCVCVCVWERDFFLSHCTPISVPLSLYTHTHTHTHTLHFFHPLIPNCLRKRRGEIPLQCLGSAVFGNHLLSHTVVGGRRTVFLQNLLSALYDILWQDFKESLRPAAGQLAGQVTGKVPGAPSGQSGPGNPHKKWWKCVIIDFFFFIFNFFFFLFLSFFLWLVQSWGGRLMFGMESWEKSKFH